MRPFGETLTNFFFAGSNCKVIGSGDMSSTLKDVEMEESAERLKLCHTYAKPPVEAETSPSSSPQKKNFAPWAEVRALNAVLLAAINKLTESQHGRSWNS